MKPDNENKTDIKCSLCGAETSRLVKRPQIVGKGANLMIVENVPMYSCRNCGHTYFTAEVARLLDQVRLNPHQHPETRLVPVAEFV